MCKGNGEDGYARVFAVGGGDSQVELERDLVEGNTLHTPDAWDPVVDLIFHADPGRLHADGPTEPVTHRLNGLHLSDVRRLLLGLQAALAAGERLGILPPELTDEEWAQRYNAACAIREAAGESLDVPKPKARDDEYDAGDVWKRGTKYDHTLPPNEPSA